MSESDCTSKELSRRALNLVVEYFRERPDEDKRKLPSILNRWDLWVTVQDSYVFALAFVDEKERRRVDEFTSKGWDPFPGLFAPAAASKNVAFDAKNTFGVYSSNVTENILAFAINPGVHFTIEEHIHLTRTPEGESIRYHVPLAFVLGLSESRGVTWNCIENSLLALATHTMDWWRGGR